MSLLADLLSKLQQPQIKREVPPNLKSIVRSAASRSAVRRRIIVLAGGVLLFVLAGIIAVHFITSIADTPDVDVNRPQLITQADVTPEIKDTPVKEMKGTGDEQSILPKKTLPARPAKIIMPSKKQISEVIVPDSAEVTSRTKENADKPVQAVEETKAIDPVARDALLYKAREFEMIQDYSSALDTYRKVLKIENDNAPVLNSIAYIYIQLGLVQEAIQYARMAEELDADYSPALINLGIAYAKSGNVTAAENYLDRAVKLQPDNKNAIFNLALLNETKQNYTSAARHFTKLMKLGDTAGSLGLARIYEKQGRNTEALKLYKKASLLEHLDQQEKMQIRRRILVLQNTGKEVDSIMTTGPPTDAAP
jgi:Tfp pilus assembly protein PilF